MAENTGYYIRQVDKHVRALTQKVQHLDQRLDLVEETQGPLSPDGRYLTFRERCIQEAATTKPRWYSIEFPLDAGGAQQRQQRSVDIDQQGWFFLDRFRITWRPTEGANAGRFRPISSGNPIIAAAAGGVPADTIDFLWGYKMGRADQERHNRDILIPSDVLYRQDADGFPAGGDAAAPNETITWIIVPTRDVENAGLLQIVMTGVQAYDVLKQ